MSTKTPAEQAYSEYCREHGRFYKQHCPECQLEEWDFYKDTQSDFIKTPVFTL